MRREKHAKGQVGTSGRFYAQIGVVLIAGALFAWWMAARADREMRAHLLQQTRLVAQTMDLVHVQALKGTPADLDSPGYQRLKKQLAAVRSANPQCRFAYLVGRRADGTPFFFVDNEKADLKDYSPPGQVYDEASEEFRRVFETRVGITEGPITDRWGTWVTALTPLTDPANGAVVAVLGMDLDARVWKWDVAAQAALPVGLMLVLLIGVTAFFAAGRRAGASPKPVLRRLLPPLAVMVTLLMAAAGTLLWQQQSQRLTERNAAQIATIVRELRVDLDNQTLGMAAVARTMAADATVQKALRHGRAGRLLSTWRPVFQTLRRENRITQFHFLDTNRVCQLRFQKPEKRGDRFDRFTAREAERTGETASGIELGPGGTFTLRVVQPVLEGGKLAGYVELGKAIRDALRRRRDHAGLELAVVVRKEHLRRQTWVERMRPLGREADWDRLPHGVVTYASQGRLPDAFAPWAGQVAGQSAHRETNREIAAGGKVWRVSATPLRDASGKEVANLLIMHDITAEKAAFARLMGLAGTVGGVLLALLVALVYILLRRTDAGLRAQQTQLRRSEEHLSATLRSIGDGVIACDGQGQVVSLNSAAETLTGWSTGEAQGRPLAEVFHIIQTGTGATAENPVERALREGVVVELTNHTALIARDGTERQIADSCAPIHDAAGVVTGAVLVFRDVTGEYGRREQLRESEARFDQLAALSGTITWEVDAQGLYTYVSHVAESVWGYRPDELVGRMHFYDRHPESVREAFKQGALAVFQRKEAFQGFVNTVQAKDGHEIWVSTNGMPLLNANGILRGYRGSDTDITERRRAEEALRESEARHRLLFDGSQDALMILAPSSLKFTSGNPAAYKLLGARDATEFTKLGLWDVSPERQSDGSLSADKAREVNEMVLREGSHFFEWTHRRLDGVDFPATVLLTRIEVAGRAVVQATVRDITAQKQAEAALRKSEEKHRRLIENSHDIIYTISAQGCFTFVSPAWTALLGYPSTQVVGQPFHSFVHPDDLAVCRLFGQSVSETGQRQEGVEYRVRHMDGSWRWHTTSAVPLKDETGTVVGMEGTARDITERKRAETYRDMGSEVLRILNEPGSLRDSIQRVASTVKARAGFDAVGIRLKAGEDFPYFAQEGFPGDFLLTENTLIERGVDGGVCRDCHGNVSLECTCGLVISGRTGPLHALFTPGGSFRTNNSFPLLDLPSDQDPRHHPRNQCMHHGYASVALVPIRMQDRIVGLLQLNDRGKGCFSPAAIEQLEGIAVHIGEALIRKQAEEALRESEEKHRLLIEHAVSAIAVHQIVLDAAGRPVDYIFLSANPAFETHTGLDVADVVGRPVSEVLPGVEETSLTKIYGQVVRTGEAVSFEQYFAPLERHFYINAYRVGEGCFATVFTDITDRKRTEVALRESERFARSTVDALSAHLAILDENGTILTVNHAWHRFAQANSASLAKVAKGANYLAVCDAATGPDAEGAAEFAAGIRAVLRGEQEEFSLEYACHSPTKKRWFLGRVTRFPGQGETRLVVAHENITGRRRVEEALRAGEARLRGITDSAQDAILMMDPGGAITFWNPAAESILGYRNEEAIGENLHKLLMPQRFLEAHGAAFPEFLRTGSGGAVGKTVELAARRKDGREIAVDLSLSAIQLNGEWHAVGVLRDISERKRAEERIEKSLLRQRGVSLLQQSLLAPTPIQDKLREVTDAIVHLFDADFCRIWLIRPGDLCERDCPHAEVREGRHVCRHRDRCLHLVTSSGRYTHIDGAGHRRLPFGCYKIGRLASDEDPKFIINDVQNDPRVHDQAWARQLGLESFAGYHLRAPGGETLGVMALFARHPILPDQDAMLEGLGSTVALVIKQAVAEEALRQSEGRFRQIVTHAGEGIGFIDAGECFQFANPAAESIFGVPANGLVGRSVLEFLSPEESRRVLEETAKRCAGLDSCYELEILRPDGARRQILLTAVPNVSGEGQFKGTFGVIHDITGRKRMEEALQAKERLLSESQAVAHIGSWSWDLEAPLFEWTPETYRIYGVSPDTFVPSQETFQNLIHPDDRAAMQAWLGAILAGEAPSSLEFRACLPDGGVRYIHDRGSLVRDAENRPIRMTGIAEDITERRRAEEALLEERRKKEAVLADLFEHAPVAYHELDREGVVRRVNAAECVLLGYQSDEMLGRPVWDFVAGTDRVASREAVFQKLSGTRPLAPVRRRYARRDGAELLLEIHDRLVRSETGQVEGLRSALFDVTEAARAEQLIHRHLIELEAAREAQEINAAELSRMVEELGLQKERAEAATRAKSEFLANMSHEIRTPMNGVIGMTGLLLDTELSDEQRRYGEIARTSGESLLGIINDILDYSKIEAKKLDLETLDFDLQILLDDFAANLAVRAQEKGLELLCSADTEVPVLLRGDPGRVRQILTNLVGNAVKFTHAGEVAVRVSLVEMGETECLLRFSVRDTGIGIPKDKIGMLFTKFSQVDASTTRTYGGTGLGLAISKQLAEMMGGEVGVASQEGTGSEFWFTARLARQSEGARAESGPPADLRGVRMLIVDDNSTSREILTTRMTSWGMRASEAEDGPGALQALYRALEENDPFRAAVIDMQMPGMDGETLGRTILADRRLAGTRMVMLTSLGARGDARRFEEIGFAAYATKPIRPQELMGVLSLALAERSGTELRRRPIATRHAVRETLNLYAGRKARILLAEDNTTNQQVALGILKKFGLRADAVANGSEAVEALETIPYDLVLMDVQMPVMDGVQAARQIRHPQSKVRHHAIPIIAMTAHAMQGDRERCLEAGMNDYVSKPVSPRALAEVLTRWLPEKNAELGMSSADGTASPNVDASAPVVFDRAGMRERLMHDEDLTQEVMQCFLDDIPRQIEALRSYLDVWEAPGAERQAHTIKGASAYVGGEALRAVAFEMEKAGKAGDLGSLRAQMGDLEREFARLKEAMILET